MSDREEGDTFYQCDNCGLELDSRETGQPELYAPSYNSPDGLPTTVCPACLIKEAKAREEQSTGYRIEHITGDEMDPVILTSTGFQSLYDVSRTWINYLACFVEPWDQQVMIYHGSTMLRFVKFGGWYRERDGTASHTTTRLKNLVEWTLTWKIGELIVEVDSKGRISIP